MKRTTEFLCVLLTASFSLNVFSNSGTKAEAAEPVYMTYIGVSGFMLESGGTKILIDGTFTQAGADGFITPPAATVNNIKNCQAPFDNINIYLVSHSHADHFNPATMDQCMQLNQNAKLICPQEVVDSIMSLTGNHYNLYSSRVTIPNLADFESNDYTIDGVTIKATKLPAYSYHADGIFVFNITMNDVHFLHLLGKVLSTDAYNNSFNSTSNDVLMISNFYLDNTSVISNLLHFKVAYVDHIYQYKSKLAGYRSTAATLSENGHKTHVFGSSMEKLKFTMDNNILQTDTVTNVSNTIKPLNDRSNTTDLDIYPNPSNGTIKLKLSSNNMKIRKIEVYDLAGKSLYDRTYKTTGLITMDLSLLQKGHYFAKATLDNKNYIIKKFILN